MSRLSVLLLFFSTSVLAENPNLVYEASPVLECPGVGVEYEQMIAQLDAIKASIKSEACSAVELQVNSLEQLLATDRAEVIEIVDNSEEQPLNAKDAEKVRDYAEAVTKKVAAIGDLFLQTNQCFEDDNADKQIASLAGFVNEASTLVGAVSGPYGAPIALAGNVVAGFLTGLDQILQSRQGFDFSKRDEWMSYVQHLCTYDSYRPQIEHLLNPEARLAQLHSLNAILTRQILLLTSKCSECEEIEQIYSINHHLGADSVQIMAGSQVQAADQRFAAPYGSYTLQNLGLRDWVLSEIKRVELEARSYWSNVSGINLLYLAKNDIETFLITREGPRFLAYQSLRARYDYNDFLYYADSAGFKLYRELERANSGIILNPVDGYPSNDKISYFRALVLNPLDFSVIKNPLVSEDLRYSWLGYKNEGLLKYNAAQTSTRVVESFCKYFQGAGWYAIDGGIRKECTNTEFQQLTELNSSIVKDVRSSPTLNQTHVPLNLLPTQSGPFSRDKIEALTRGIESREL